MSEGEKSTTRIGCGWCETHIDGPCPECAKVRRRALALRDSQGICVAEIAARLGIAERRAARLLLEADEALDMQRYKLDAIPVAVLRTVFERRCSEDPSLTEASVARAAKVHRIDLRRAVGHSPSKGARGKAQAQVTVGLASRIVAALGVSPHEVEGL